LPGTVFLVNQGKRDQMTAAAIARLANVGRAAVSNWRRRYPDFPKPVGGSPASPTFDRAEVEAWLKATGKADQLATAGSTETGTQRVGGMDWLYEIAETVPERPAAKPQPGNLLARSVAALLPRETGTPQSNDSNAGDAPVVLDPACGGALILMAVANRFGDRVKLAGQEINEGAARIAAFNLSNTANGAAYEIHGGDSLLDDQLTGYLGKAAAVVCEPPLDSPQWPSAELTTDPRWEFGIPAPRDAELAWVQHCYAHLRPRGAAVIVVPQRTCVQPSGEHIRGALIRSGVLRAVISLPKGMSSSPGTDICLWILRRPYTQDHAPVRMIDLSGLGDPADVPGEFAAWQRLFDDADPTISRAVSRLELLDADASLLPSRYVTTRVEASAGELARVTRSLEALYAKVGQGLPLFSAPKQQTRISYVTLGELERVGALTIRPRDATPREGDVLLRTQGRPPVVATGTKIDDTGVAQVVEIDRSRLDPRFVATFLSADVVALPVANTLGAVNRDDLRRCRIPRMPLAEQHRYSEAFRRMQELDAVLNTLTTISRKLIEQTVHGLTTGVLSPDDAVAIGEESTVASGPTHQKMAADIWSVADLLRGDYKRHEYGQVVLPFTVLRRLDAVMAPTREAVRARNDALDMENKERLLTITAKLPFYNTSRQDFTTIAADPGQVAKNLRDYVNGFSANVRRILSRFDFDNQITKLAEAKILYQVVGKFAAMKDLDKLSNHHMGYVFEHLIRLFADASNETAGEHFTPREVIELMVKLLIAPDKDTIAGVGQVINILDPACGTGGMLTAAEEKIERINPGAKIYLFGQEINGESWAVCESEMLLRDQPGSVSFGNSFSDDAYRDRKFDYLLANPPFGVEWKKVKDAVEDEAATGYAGRFGAGLPRINDGSFLFLQHMISKMQPVEDRGSRLAIVFNGSPLFTGGAESGESKIRRWILENDWLEGIVALPDQLFYNTGISTYFWILSNRKVPELRGKVILLDARDQWEKMRKSLGDKRKQISDAQIDHITEMYTNALAVAADPSHADHAKVKIFHTREFGYQRITVERPLKLRFEITEDTLAALEASKLLAKWDGREDLVGALRGSLGTVWWTKKEASAALHAAAKSGGARWPATAAHQKAIWSAVSVSDPEGEVQHDKDGSVLPDPDLRDYENVPLDEDIDEYFAREVTPHVPDAWIDYAKTKVGYEIPFTRHFYVYTPPRPLAEIDAELRDLESQIQKLLGEVTG
jgi:type I restriction enzyme M protein